MSELSEMVKTQSEKILMLERELAAQTRRTNVAEAWQRRLTHLLAMSGKCPDPELCNDIGDCDRNLLRASTTTSQDGGTT